MENRTQKNSEEEQRIKQLQLRKEQNLKTLERRINELELEKEKQGRKFEKKEGLV